MRNPRDIALEAAFRRVATPHLETLESADPAPFGSAQAIRQQHARIAIESLCGLLADYLVSVDVEDKAQKRRLFALHNRGVRARNRG